MNIETEEINQVDSDGLRHGFWKFKLTHTLCFEGNYVNGHMQGLWKYYGGELTGDSCYNNRRSHHEGNYIDGLRNGLWRHYSNGCLCNYVNDIIEGEVIISVLPSL